MTHGLRPIKAAAGIGVPAGRRWAGRRDKAWPRRALPGTLGGMNSSPAIVWLRRDLRLSDHPAFAAACRRGGPVIPVFIFAPEEEGIGAPGAASRWWLRRSIDSLDSDLRARGSRIVVRKGPSLPALQSLLAETGAGAVFWNRLYEPETIRRDVMTKQVLEGMGIAVETFGGNLLFEPWSVRTGAGGPFRVFTPFYRACVGAITPPAALRAPRGISPPARWPRSLSLDDLDPEPESEWAAGLRDAWRPGEKGAAALLAGFRSRALRRYPEDRDRPAVAGTSRLSPHLHFGEITPGRVWRAIGQAGSAHRDPGWLQAAEAYQRQIIWREFAHHVLYHFPAMPKEPLRADFASFPWKRAGTLFHAWQKGQTGYAIVDAGMRQLRATGWMHNRVRMIAASFLVKDLLVSWREGAGWFRDMLVDADLANNTFGWQWTAGCGADAAPYFRIFNPIVQGERFDPRGEYVRRWIPELSAIPDAWIHRPWEAPTEILRAAGVKLGETYPEPVVDHAVARKRALAALASIRRK
jgi:deoxyribodipyrimidine photo-lyase